MFKRSVSLILVASMAIFSAESMIVSHTLPLDKIEYSSENGYNVIRILGCIYPYQIGKPMIPVLPVVYLIPPDARLTGVKIVSTKMEKHGDSVQIKTSAVCTCIYKKVTTTAIC